MATTDKNTIYSWFQTDDFPTEEQFHATWDSFWHKTESIPMGKIQGLNQMFVNTATVAQLNAKADVDHTHPDLEDYINDLQVGLDSQVIVNENQDDRLTNLEGINYTWNPTNRTLTLYNSIGQQLSQVSLLSLDNEGTDLRYNSTNKSLELWNDQNQLIDTIPVASFVGNVGSQLALSSNTLQLKDGQGNILSTVNFEVNNINGLQTALNNKQDKLSSFDESILIENTGNIEGNVSLFTDYFNAQNCILSFTPIQIIGIYKNGIKLLPSQYSQPTLKNIIINSYTDETIEIQYTHLKNINLWP